VKVIRTISRILTLKLIAMATSLDSPWAIGKRGSDQ